jgi:hypothetical protein
LAMAAGGLLFANSPIALMKRSGVER